MAEEGHANPFRAAAAQWMESWRAMAGANAGLSENWSNSMLQFFKGSEASGFGTSGGKEFFDAIEQLTKGPRLADVFDFDRKLANLMSAWAELQRKLARYQVIAARPWMRAAEQYSSQRPPSDAMKGWREQVAAWNLIADKELIANQRSEEFLSAQKELLQAATDFRMQQSKMADDIASFLGMPTQRDFDEVTRQLTELRREVRSLQRWAGTPGSRPRGEA